MCLYFSHGRLCVCVCLSLGLSFHIYLLFSLLSLFIFFGLSVFLFLSLFYLSIVIFFFVSSSCLCSFVCIYLILFVFVFKSVLVYLSIHHPYVDFHLILPLCLFVSRNSIIRFLSITLDISVYLSSFDICLSSFFVYFHLSLPLCFCLYRSHYSWCQSYLFLSVSAFHQ